MVTDEEYTASNGKRIIEVLVGDEVKVWVPIVAMNLWAIGNDGTPIQIKEIHVRILEK